MEIAWRDLRDESGEIYLRRRLAVTTDARDGTGPDGLLPPFACRVAPNPFAGGVAFDIALPEERRVRQRRRIPAASIRSPTSTIRIA